MQVRRPPRVLAFHYVGNARHPSAFRMTQNAGKRDSLLRQLERNVENAIGRSSTETEFL